MLILILWLAAALLVAVALAYVNAPGFAWVLLGALVSGGAYATGALVAPVAVFAAVT